MALLRDLRPAGVIARRLALLISLAALACAGPQRASDPLRPVTAGPRWPVKTREHVDLWLHGFAMLMDDTSTVPLFDRGYRDRLVVERNRRALYTALDTARRELVTGLRARPALEGAQFLALYFGSWDELQRGMTFFLRAEGDPRNASSPEVASVVAFLAQQFPRQEDREWARRFTAALDGERTQFFHAWWVEEQRRRTVGLASADSLWQTRWRPVLQPYLNATQQQNGDVIPSLVLGGEGRAVPAGKLASQYAVAWPTTADSAEMMLFAFAHEAAGAVASVAIADHLTPAQQRAGMGNALAATGLVRGGALLVARIDPTLAERYARWYLGLAGRPIPASGALDALAAAFPMPEEMVASLRRQIDLAFTGI